jgi:hypothetical protein
VAARWLEKREHVGDTEQLADCLVGIYQLQTATPGPRAHVKSNNQTEPCAVHLRNLLQIQYDALVQRQDTPRPVIASVFGLLILGAVLLDRSLRLSEHESALEVGWLLAEMEQRFGYGLDELARRFDRSVSWVSRRLALVEVLPEAIQQQVREGKIPAQVALKFLVPAARQSLEACQRMAAIFAQHHCDTREACQLYGAWRKGSPAVRKRILDDPELFFKGRGKTGLACGLLLKALENGYRCQFVKAQDLFDEMYASLADRSSRQLLKRLTRLDVLLIDLCEVVSNVE